MTKLICQPTEPAISRGIKTVGIGKKGSQPLDLPLIQGLIQDLKAGKASKAAVGAFFAALVLKGITDEEKALAAVFSKPETLSNPILLVEALTRQAPDFVKVICVCLLKGETLDKQTAYALGKFLMSDQPGDGARGIAASALRVRYETDDEYQGLLLSLQETIEPPFRESVPLGRAVIQLSEPFDGVDHSYMITPLIADYLQKQNYRVVNLVGRNSGPKFVFNLLDLAQNLEARFLKRNQELDATQPLSGWFINQADLSQSMDRWVDIRRQTIKRPFLATLEKFLNPVKADILITSAFHPPYTEKMLTIAERAGFPGIVIVRNGIEGSMAFALKRPVKISCSARQENGSYIRHEFEFNAEQYLQQTIPLEEKLDNPFLEENVRLIQTFQQQGRTDNQLFDWRVKASCAGLLKAIMWIQQTATDPSMRTTEVGCSG